MLTTMNTVSTGAVLAAFLLGALLGGVGYYLWISLRDQLRRRARRHPQISADLQLTLEMLPQMAVIFDRSLHPIAMNAEARDQPVKLETVQRASWFRSYLREAMVSRRSLSRPSNENDTFWVHVFALSNGLIVALIDDEHEKYDTQVLRRDFISNASHELNTPVAAISLLSEALQQAQDDPDKVRQFTASLDVEAKRLATLTRDLAHLSLAQSGGASESIGVVNASQITQRAVEVHRTLAETRNISLTFGAATNEHDRSKDFLVQADARSLSIAVGNLIENGIIYSDPGGHVGVGIKAEGRTVSITVADQGEGISDREKTKVFERFYRTDSSRTRETGGTGLGLSIARNTALALRGDITVWSQRGVGSTFTFTLPRVRQQAVSESLGTGQRKE